MASFRPQIEISLYTATIFVILNGYIFRSKFDGRLICTHTAAMAVSAAGIIGNGGIAR